MNWRFPEAGDAFCSLQDINGTTAALGPVRTPATKFTLDDAGVATTELTTTFPRITGVLSADLARWLAVCWFRGGACEKSAERCRFRAIADAGDVRTAMSGLILRPLIMAPRRARPTRETNRRRENVQFQPVAIVAASRGVRQWLVLARRRAHTRGEDSLHARRTLFVFPVKIPLTLKTSDAAEAGPMTIAPVDSRQTPAPTSCETR